MGCFAGCVVAHLHDHLERRNLLCRWRIGNSLASSLTWSIFQFSFPPHHAMIADYWRLHRTITSNVLWKIMGINGMGYLHGLLGIFTPSVISYADVFVCFRSWLRVLASTIGSIYIQFTSQSIHLRHRITILCRLIWSHVNLNGFCPFVRRNRTCMADQPSSWWALLSCGTL